MSDFNATKRLNEFFRWYAEVVLEIPHEQYEQKQFGEDILKTAASTTNAYFKGEQRGFPKKHWGKLSAILQEHGLPVFEKWEGYKELSEIEDINKEVRGSRRKRIADIFEAILEHTDLSRVQLGKMFIGNYKQPEHFINGLLMGKYNTERILPKLYSMKLRLEGKQGLWVANPHYIEAVHSTSAKFIPVEGDQLASLLESPEALNELHTKIGVFKKLANEIQHLTGNLINK